MGDYSEWEQENEYFEDDDNRPSLDKVNNINRVNGVKSYIRLNGDHIKGLYNKETQYDSIDMRIILLYSNKNKVKSGCLLISKDFENFKIWFKQLKNI